VDYLAPRAILAQRALPLAMALGFLALVVIADLDGSQAIERAALLLAAPAGLALAVAPERIERWLVRRPLPFTGAGSAAIDDALRSHSVQAFAGAVIGLFLLGLSAMFGMVAADDQNVLSVAFLVQCGLLAAAILAVPEVGKDSWWTRRRVDRGARVAA
jgi:hypothetical protein